MNSNQSSGSVPVDTENNVQPQPPARLKMLALPIWQPTLANILIVMVGPGREGDPESARKQSAWAAVKYHLGSEDQTSLRECWVVTSEGIGGGLQVAQQLEGDLKKDRVTVHIRTVKDAFAIQDTYEVVRKIIDNEIWKSKMFVGYEDVVADVTGGTAPMSIGMALACHNRVRLQYMYGGSRGIASQPVEMQFVPSAEVIS